MRESVVGSINEQVVCAAVFGGWFPYERSTSAAMMHHVRGSCFSAQVPCLAVGGWHSQQMHWLPLPLCVERSLTHTGAASKCIAQKKSLPVMFGEQHVAQICVTVRLQKKWTEPVLYYEQQTQAPGCIL